MTVETWKEFEESLSSEEKELLEEILYGVGYYFTKREAVLLKGMNKRGKEMGLWR